MYPEMQEDGTYDDSFSLTVQAVGGTLGYDPSVHSTDPVRHGGQLLCWFTFRRHYRPRPDRMPRLLLMRLRDPEKAEHGHAPLRAARTQARREKRVLDAIWALLTPVIILGGIYSGIFSPTESAAVACVYALIVGTCIYKELTLKKIYNALFNAMKGSVAVMFLCTCATLLRLAADLPGHDQPDHQLPDRDHQQQSWPCS